MGGGEATAAERGDEGEDEVPRRPDMVVKPGVCGPASRRRGLCAELRAQDEPSEGGGASVVEKSGEI